MASTKKQALFDESDSDSGSDGGAPTHVPKVNKEYALKFEHNKKREELSRLEEKYKDDRGTDDSDSSDDDEGFLATEELDDNINAVLDALDRKDGSLLDKSIQWYKQDPNEAPAPKEKSAKPMTLRDYHRINLMKGAEEAEGGSDNDQDNDDIPRTYAQEQEDIRKQIQAEIAQQEVDSDDGDNFFQAKEKKLKNKGGASTVHSSRAARVTKPEQLPDPDKEPEQFLRQYAGSRAWAEFDKGPNSWEAFDSDDESEDERKEQLEYAFNMRFENPEMSNEVIKTYARGNKSVRRDKLTARQSQRQAEQDRKAEEKQEREEERAQLRRLKLEEAEGKLKKIKHAAGVSGKVMGEDEIMELLDEAWDDDKWEDAMGKRFGDQYYADDDAEFGGGVEEEDSDDGDKGKGKSKKSKKVKKPKWDDDIDIKDLVPEFEDDEAKPQITLSDVDSDDDEAGQEEEEEEEEDQEDQEDEPSSKRKKRTKSKDLKKARLESQRNARRSRSRLEALIDSKMEIDDPSLLKTTTSRTAPPSSSAAGAQRRGFAYRETSPTSFGMTARDILLAPSDAALNDYAGLKKLASFREENRKKKERKKLGKKARLRMWRREVFGGDYEPEGGFERFVEEEEVEHGFGGRSEGGGRKRKHSGDGEGKKKHKEGKEDGVKKYDGDGEKAKKKRKRNKKSVVEA